MDSEDLRDEYDSGRNLLRMHLHPIFLLILILGWCAAKINAYLDVSQEKPVSPYSPPHKRGIPSQAGLCLLTKCCAVLFQTCVGERLKPDHLPLDPLTLLRLRIGHLV